MAGDNFTRDKMQWLDQVAEDLRVSAGAFRLAHHLASKFLSREKGVAYPSQETLAALLGITLRHVLRLTNELVTAGHLSVQRGGRGHANRYRLIKYDRTDMSDQTEIRPDKYVHSSTDDRTFPSNMTGRKCPPNPMKEPIGGNGAPGGAPAWAAPGGAAGEIEDAFEAFCETYPKPVDPALAILFAEIIGGGEATVDEILSGARLAGRRGQYATAPGPWLKGKGWTKESEAKPASRSRSGTRRGKQSALEIITRRFAEEDGNG